MVTELQTRKTCQAWISGGIPENGTADLIINANRVRQEGRVRLTLIRRDVHQTVPDQRRIGVKMHSPGQFSSADRQSKFRMSSTVGRLRVTSSCRYA